MGVDEGVKKNKRGVKALLTIALIVLLVALFFMFFVRITHVESGYIGIKSTLSGLSDSSAKRNVSLVRGYSIYMPLYTDFKIYPVTIQTAAYDTMRVNTDDGVEFVIKPRISFHVSEDKAALYFTSVNDDLGRLKNGYLKEIIASSYTSILGGYTSDSLTRHQSEADREVESLIISKMTDIGLEVDNLNTNLQIPKKIKDIIELRSLAEHNILLAQNQKRLAYAQADIARMEDSLRYSSLTDLAIKKLYIDKWDGKLPAYGNVSSKLHKDIIE